MKNAGMGNENGKREKLSLEDELRQASLSIMEEPDEDEDFGEGYYLDEDFDDIVLDEDLDEDLDGPAFDFDISGPAPSSETAAASAASAAVECSGAASAAECSGAAETAEHSGAASEAGSPAAGKALHSRRQGSRRVEREEAGPSRQTAAKPVPPPAPAWNPAKAPEGYDRAEKPEEGDQAEEPKSGSPSAARRILPAVGLAALAAVLGCVSYYLVRAQKFHTAYFPNTVINGVDVGGMEVEQVKSLMSSAIDGYKLRLTDRDGGETMVSGGKIGLHTVFDGTLETMLEEQNPYLWGWYSMKGKDSQVETVVAYDEDAFRSYLEELPLLGMENVRPYKEAYLSDYVSGQGYEIIPAEIGNEMDREVFFQAVSDAVLSLKQELSLEEAGCYIHAPETELPAELVEKRDTLNRYANMTVTYQFGSGQEVLNGDELHQWITYQGNGAVSVDEAMVGAYVEALAKKYNTAYTKRKFKTSYGPEVTVSGFYGWRINQKEEKAALAQIVASGESQSREPEYSQKGASHEGNDYGSTYAEVNLTAQHLFLYKDGKKILESDFVSGNVSKGYTTPPGIFGITYKQRDAVLKGQGYASPVKFWMPFNGGIGFHDASWRSSFGGNIYRTNGSHGCVNMPYSAAKTLFENVYAGMPVICYNLEGTESGKSSSASGTGETKPAETKPTETKPAETKPAETAPAPTQPSETSPAPTKPSENPPAPTTPSAQPNQNQTGNTAGPGGSGTNPGNTAGPGGSTNPGSTAGPGGGGTDNGSAGGPGGSTNPGNTAGPGGSGADNGSAGGPGGSTNPGNTAGPGGSNGGSSTPVTEPTAAGGAGAPGPGSAGGSSSVPQIPSGPGFSN